MKQSELRLKSELNRTQQNENETGDSDQQKVERLRKTFSKKKGQNLKIDMCIRVGDLKNGGLKKDVKIKLKLEKTKIRIETIIRT